MRHMISYAMMKTLNILILRKECNRNKKERYQPSFSLLSFYCSRRKYSHTTPISDNDNRLNAFRYRY